MTAAGSAGRTALRRYPCPECGREVCTRDGLIYTSLPDEHGARYLYVHLRRHNASKGVRCAGWNARHEAPEVTP